MSKTNYESELLEIRHKLRAWGALPEKQVDLIEVRQLQRRMAVLLALASGASQKDAELFAACAAAVMDVAGLA